MLRLSQLRRLAACMFALAIMAPVCLFLPHAAAQDDPNDVPLGDVARNLRKKNPPAKAVIDDDNLTTVMSQIDNKRSSGTGLKYLMAGDAKNFQISGPDATCSLSFSASAKALLSTQFAQMELPPSELSRLEGPATIEGDALNVSVSNRTDWHISEVTVAVTVVKKSPPAEDLTSETLIPGASPMPYEFSPDAVRPEKKPDTTVIYRMRAAAPPSTTTVFSAPTNLDLAPGDEWHWAIVQARGYPPESRMEQARMEKNQSGSNSSNASDSTTTGTQEPASLTPTPVSLPQPQ